MSQRRPQTAVYTGRMHGFLVQVDGSGSVRYQPYGMDGGHMTPAYLEPFNFAVWTLTTQWPQSLDSEWHTLREVLRSDPFGLWHFMQMAATFIQLQGLHVQITESEDGSRMKYYAVFIDAQGVPRYLPYGKDGRPLTPVWMKAFSFAVWIFANQCAGMNEDSVRSLRFALTFDPFGLSFCLDAAATFVARNSRSTFPGQRGREGASQPH